MTFSRLIRALTIVAAALWLPMAARSAAQGASARIEGVVTRAGLGTPLAGAQVVLIPDGGEAYGIPPGIGLPGPDGPAGAPAPGMPPMPPMGPGGPGMPGFPGGFKGDGRFGPTLAIAPATTDNQGRFAFGSLPPGSYWLQVQANGHVGQGYGQGNGGSPGAPIKLSAGESKDVAISLTPAGTVSGRIRDRDQRPLASVSVQLLRVSYDPTGRRMLEPVGAARTNDRGDYRIYWVNPGHYYLKAGNALGGDMVMALYGGPAVDYAPGFGPGGFGMPNPNEIPASAAMAFFPGAPDLAGARAIEIPSGGELTGIDWLLPALPATYRVRARIVDSKTGEPPMQAQVFIAPAGMHGFEGFADGFIPQSVNPVTGAVEFRNVAPGAYTITAMTEPYGEFGGIDGVEPDFTIKDPEVVQEPIDGAVAPPEIPQFIRPDDPQGIPFPPDGEIPPDFPGGFPPHIDPGMSTIPMISIGTAAVTVSDADVDDIVVTVGPAGSIHAQLRAEGGIRQTELRGMSIQLMPDDFNPFLPYVGGMPDGPIGADGAIWLRNVTSGKYRLWVEPLPENAYLKEARLDGMDLLAGAVDWSGGGIGTLEVLVSGNGGRIRGTLMDNQSNPSPGGEVVLVPDRARDRADLYKTATADANGRFTFAGVAPGSYKIFSWDKVEPFGWFDPSLIERSEPRASAVTLAEGATESVQVRIISQGGAQ